MKEDVVRKRAQYEKQLNDLCEVSNLPRPLLYFSERRPVSSSVTYTYRLRVILRYFDYVILFMTNQKYGEPGNNPRNYLLVFFYIHYFFLPFCLENPEKVVLKQVSHQVLSQSKNITSDVLQLRIIFKRTPGNIYDLVPFIVAVSCRDLSYRLRPIDNTARRKLCQNCMNE